MSPRSKILAAVVTCDTITKTNGCPGVCITQVKNNVIHLHITDVNTWYPMGYMDWMIFNTVAQLYSISFLHCTRNQTLLNCRSCDHACESNQITNKLGKLLWNWTPTMYVFIGHCCCDAEDHSITWRSSEKNPVAGGVQHHLDCQHQMMLCTTTVTMSRCTNSITGIQTLLSLRRWLRWPCWPC